MNAATLHFQQPNFPQKTFILYIFTKFQVSPTGQQGFITRFKNVSLNEGISVTKQNYDHLCIRAWSSVYVCKNTAWAHKQCCLKLDQNSIKINCQKTMRKCSKVKQSLRFLLGVLDTVPSRLKTVCYQHSAPKPQETQLLSTIKDLQQTSFKIEFLHKLVKVTVKAFFFY